METCVIHYRIDDEVGDVTASTLDGVSQFHYENGLKRLQTLASLKHHLEERGLSRVHRVSQPTPDGGLEIALLFCTKAA